MMEDLRGIECVWTDPSEHPQCQHGPTLLFGKYIDGKMEQFYACSACRDKKLCRFYFKHGESMSKIRKEELEKERKKYVSNYPRQKLFIRFNELMSKNAENRCYCHDCEKLIFASEKDKHGSHKITENLSDHQMTHPTELMRPLNDAKKEAQYLFSKKSTKDITDMLLKLGAKQLLCIGTPRIHEYILENYDHKISSLLLDFDARFHNFFGPLNYCWYNLFNHHFFNEDAKDLFKDFLTQNGGKDTYLICDPPFGGRVEAISHTLKKISDLHKKWNNIKDENDCLKIMVVFPYFMEPLMRQKSNPPNVSGGLKDLKMSDYKVDYDNHPLFVSEKNGQKKVSPVNIFTNVPLSSFELSSDDYKYCKRCQKWVCVENRHCKKCKDCTSKSGKKYRHCNLCTRCVKATWKHCGDCGRCALEKHACGQKPKNAGKCFKCGEHGHVEKDCNINKNDENPPAQTGKNKKRKLSNDDIPRKKKKLDNPAELSKKGKKEKKNMKKKLVKPPENEGKEIGDHDESNQSKKIKKQKPQRKQSENFSSENNSIKKKKSKNAIPPVAEEKKLKRNGISLKLQKRRKLDKSNAEIKNNKKKLKQ